MDKVIMVSSGYGGNTRAPFVQIEAEEIDKPIQMSPIEARALALNLLEAAEAAESDGFIVEFTKGELKSDDRHALVLLTAFREYRNKARGGS